MEGTEEAPEGGGRKMGVILLVVGLIAGLLAGYFAGSMIGGGGGDVKTFVVIPYHWGFAIYNADGVEVEAISVSQGDIVELVVMPASALSMDLHHYFEERTIAAGIANESQIEAAEDEGLMTHTVTIAEYDVEVVVTGGGAEPADAHEVVRFEADKTGSFEIRCMRYCGFGHDDMVLSAGLVVS